MLGRLGTVLCVVALAVIFQACNGCLIECGLHPIPTRTPGTPPTSQATVLPTSSAAPASTSAGATAIASTSPAESPAPTQSSSPTLPVSSAIVVDAATIDRHLDALWSIAQRNGGLRADTLPGYDESADYVESQLAGFGLTVERKPFDFTFFNETSVSLRIGDASWSAPDWMHAMLYSAPGNSGGLVQTVGIEDGKSTITGACSATDWDEFVAGRIALVMSGPCLRRDQITLAHDAGAIAVIALYPHWESGQARRPTLLDPSGITIPAIGVGREPAEALLAAAHENGSAQVTVETDEHPATIDNVIAERAGATDRVVMMGAHLDSVLDGPGMNDNASGVATVLAIAAAVASATQPTDTIRFGFWGAEEYGDLGSQAYVQSLPAEEMARLDSYLNLDMVGSPNPARFVYDEAGAAPGSAQITQELLDALAGAGSAGLTTDPGGASDHYAFTLAGIPTGGVFSGLAPLTAQQAEVFGGQPGMPADPCYHLACDTRTNVNTASAVVLGQAAANVLVERAY